MPLRLTRRRWLAASTAVPIGALAWYAARRPRGPVAVAEPRLGINLSRPVDWNTELPFVDVFKLSRPWISQRQDADWGAGPTLAVDDNGWVRRIEPGCWAETLLCSVAEGHFPSGTYTVLYEGKGEIRIVANGAAVVAEVPGRQEIAVDSTRGGLRLQITSTDPQDYIRNIRVMQPEYLRRDDESPFHSGFVRRWSGVACIRFMDWMLTNGSSLSAWTDRPTPGHATFTARGVPVETMLGLCNELGAEPWFCMPHLADDDFVRNFAETVRNDLNPGLRVWIEYSNELWNGAFEQRQAIIDRGTRMALGQRPAEAAWRYTAHRSVEIFDIWATVFEGSERLVCVMPSHAISPDLSEQLLDYQDAFTHVDALAVAPYMVCNVQPSGKGLTTRQVEAWSVDEALDYMEYTALPAAVAAIQAQKRVADRFGVRLVAYEGGQHMVGVNGGENSDAVARLFHAANSHRRMGSIYTKYYDAWTRYGGDLMCHFSSVGEWNEFGSWGLMRYGDDNAEDYAKYSATIDWARACGQHMDA